MESLDSGGWSCLVAASRGCRLLATLVTDPDITEGRASEEVTPGLWDLPDTQLSYLLILK